MVVFLVSWVVFHVYHEITWNQSYIFLPIQMNKQCYHQCFRNVATPNLWQKIGRLKAYVSNICYEHMRYIVALASQNCLRPAGLTWSDLTSTDLNKHHCILVENFHIHINLDQFSMVQPCLPTQFSVSEIPTCQGRCQRIPRQCPASQGCGHRGLRLLHPARQRCGGWSLGRVV